MPAREHNAGARRSDGSLEVHAVRRESRASFGADDRAEQRAQRKASRLDSESESAHAVSVVLVLALHAQTVDCELQVSVEFDPFDAQLPGHPIDAD